jgi:lipopolysaccharide transport system ATP-binding protein
MSDIVIKVENLSKQYRLGSVGTGSLVHDVNRGWHRIRGKEDPYLKIGETNDRTVKGKSEYIWALKDINFEVKQGEVLGIIGRNGAGKSTLLKILSRTTTPTTGSVKIKGRVASLLEVGTGFHPELSGRENIFLNGAILGMTKAEIKSKFDEIVDFAGVERYIDTPVKRYSSGMYVRLAFGVAAHLEPEILIVDEVLAVGDAEFQKKALGKMKDVSIQDGRTVLFVSHNLAAINQLCDSAVLLANGKLDAIGVTETIMDLYLKSTRNDGYFIERSENFEGNHFKSAFICDTSGKRRSELSFSEGVSIAVHMILPQYNEDLELAIRVEDKNKAPVFTIHEKINNFYDNDYKATVRVSIPGNFLTPGSYSLVMCINHPGVQLFDVHEDVLPFTLIDTGSEFARYDGARYGSVFANYSINKI